MNNKGEVKMGKKKNDIDFVNLFEDFLIWIFK